jgi:signal transduction histidine kinase
MSHELRTPLNAMIGFTELMLAGVAGPMTDKQKHQLGRVHANSLRLLSLIDDVLDLSRIEAGRVDIQEEPFSPREMVSKVAAQTSSLAERKALRFVQKIDEGMPQTMLGDQARIEQVILNLLSNAFKFTSQGEVELAVKPVPESQQWVLTVRDTGVGIPPHAQEYIFEEFRQVDGSSRRVYGGSGLGLAICRNLCRLMDGDIRVQSALGEGSTFTVTLPLKLSQVDLSPKPVAVSAAD